MTFTINIHELKVGMRVVVRHKHARDVLPKPGGPIEAVVKHLPGKIVEHRIRTGRHEYRVQFDEGHPTGQEWFWRGVVYPEGKQP